MNTEFVWEQYPDSSAAKFRLWLNYEGEAMIAERNFKAEKEPDVWKRNNGQPHIMNADDVHRIHPLSVSHREILLRMYRSFEPLGLALGLPPGNEDNRVVWIEHALRQEINLGAFSSSGDLVGHSFLAISDVNEAEIAFFVRQEYRRRGIGTELVTALLPWSARRGLHHVWALVGAQDVPAEGLLRRCGFRFSRYVLPAIEFGIDLPVLL
jgi:GNAT superfamily N-acetyltransferase